MLRVPLIVVALMIVTAIPVVGQELALQAEVLRGTCEEPGESIADLTAPLLSDSEPVGASDARTAANSFSVVPVAYAEMLSSMTAIAVSVDGERIACSSIGGVANAAGDLAVGLMPTNDVDAFGIAYLSPNDANPSQTDVSLFVVPPSDSRTAQPASVDITEGAITGESIIDINANAEAAIEDAANESGDEESAPEPTSTPRPTPSPPTPTPVPELGTADNPVPIGTALTGAGLEVTPLSAYYSYGYGFSTPKGGFTYLVLEVQIQNVSDGSESYGYTSFSGQDLDSGAGYDSIWVLADGLLDSGSLDPGEYVSGTIILEVQETAAQVLVKYDPAMFDPNDLYWLVG